MEDISSIAAGHPSVAGSRMSLPASPLSNQRRKPVKSSIPAIEKVGKAVSEQTTSADAPPMVDIDGGPARL